MWDNRCEIQDLPSVWQNLLRHFALEFECALPVVVLSYDREKNVVTCRGAVNRVDTDGNSVQRTEMSVPCFNPCGAGLGINFPISPGDTGWVLAADRDPANFKQAKTIANPQTVDLHRYVFGVFLPDIISGFTIDADDQGALVIENKSATTRISVKDNRIKITRQNVSLETNGFYVNVNTPTSQLTIADDGTVTMKSTVINLDGLCNVTTGASGVITLASVATVANGIVTGIY